MRAARYHGNQDLRVEDIDEPKLTEGKVLVDIAWCGICGSDLHEYLIGPISNTKTPHPLTGEAMPVAMGHEFCGRVRNPPLDSGLQDGDAVMVDPRIMCGKCRHCDVGNGYGCGQLGYRGYNTGGGFAEKAAVDLKSLHKLPNNISLDDAAILEPMAVVVHAVKETGITEWKNKEVLVVGAGPIGIALIIALIAYGAEKIVVSEPAAIRRKQVAEFVSVVLDPRSDDVVEKCRSLTDGQGADVVFDCAGVPKGLEVGFDALRLHGQYMNVAVWEEPVSQRNLTILNSADQGRW